MPKSVTPGSPATITSSDHEDTYWKPFTGLLNLFPDPEPTYKVTTDTSKNLAGSSASAYAAIFDSLSQAEVARTIEMNGTNSSQRARFEFSGTVNAHLDITGPASAEVTLWIFVADPNNGTLVAEKSILTHELEHHVLTSWSKTESMANLEKDPVIYVEFDELIDGQSYWVGVKCETVASGSVLGWGHSDVYPDSTGFDFNGLIQYDSIDISWI